ALTPRPPDLRAVKRSYMRRVIITTAGLLLVSTSSFLPRGTPQEGAICPVPGADASFEARLHAIELENGCLDVDQEAEPASWPPGWDKATIAGGDVAPI